MIYFISDGSAIKIGRAENVQSRLKDLNCGSSRELVLLTSIDGHSKEEAAIHAELTAFRVGGEWFRDCADVRDAIGRYTTAGVKPKAPKARRPYRRAEREVPNVDVRLMKIDLFRLPMAEARSAYLKSAIGAMEAILIEVKRRKASGEDTTDLIARAAQISAEVGPKGQDYVRAASEVDPPQ